MLSERELMLIEIRATDQASAVMGRVAANASLMGSNIQRAGIRAYAMSQAFTVVGRSMMRFGFITLAAMAGAGKVAMDFYHAMALANTQAQLGTERFKELSNQALAISSKFGIANTQIAEALYDIFSTTKQTADEAIISAGVLAKASVAGATQMRTATRGVIDIQNAFGLSAKSTTRVLDLQFQMLRKSGGTYDELVSAFGNVIGSAKQTGQRLRSVAGAIAFLTMRGRTQAQASISVSRALDQIGRHAKDMKATIGVSVYDAKGDFRSLEDIITDMGKAFSGMTTRQQVNAMTEMFGAGSIQANRFFRTAIPQFRDLNKSVDSLSKKDVSGQLQKAFQIMKREDPSFIFHRLIESIKNLGVTVATTLAPAFKDVIDWIQRGVNWFGKLDDATKSWVGKALVLGGVFALVGGKILMVLGGILRIYSFAIRGAMGLATLSAATGGVIAAIALLAAGAYLIYKNWDKVAPFLSKVWKEIKKAAEVVVKWFQTNVVPILKKVVTFILRVWNEIVAWWDKNGPAIISAAKRVISWFVNFFQMVWRNWGDEIVAVVKTVWDLVKTVVTTALHIIQGVIQVVAAIINTDWKAFWEGIRKIIGAVWDLIVQIAKTGLTLLWNAIKAGLEFVIRGIVNLVRAMVHAGARLLNGLAMGAKAGMIAVVEFLVKLPGRIIGFFINVGQWLWNHGWRLIKGLWEGIKAAFFAVVNWFRELPGKIKEKFSDARHWLYQAGKDVIQGFIDGVKALAQDAIDATVQVANDIQDQFGYRMDLGSPSKVFFKMGVNVMEGLRLGLNSERSNVLKTIGAITNDISGQRPYMDLGVRMGRTGAGNRERGSVASPRVGGREPTNIHIQMTGTTREEAQKVARELDWTLRTGGWS